MNRKEMIIVAALINAGLLVVLFVSAVQKEPLENFSSLPSLKKKQMRLQEEKEMVFLDQNSIDRKLDAYHKKSSKEIKKQKQALSPLILTPKNPSVPLKENISKDVIKKEDGFQFVTVERGDVLEKIAKKYGVLVDEIQSLNHLLDSRLQIGQVLKLPLKEKSKKSFSKEKYYEVKGGDNPWTIAKENGIQVEELLRLNHMDEKKAKKLRPGDKLRIK